MAIRNLTYLKKKRFMPLAACISAFVFFFTIMLSGTVLAQMSPDESAQALKRIVTELEELEKEAERLKNIGYSGPTLQKDFKILAGKVLALKQQLAGLNIQKITSEILVHKDRLDGPTFTGKAVNGDVLVFSSIFSMTGSKENPALTVLSWNISDAKGNPVKSAQPKLSEVAETGGMGRSKYDLPIKNFPNGDYKVQFTRSVNGQAKSLTKTFSVFQEIRAINALVSTDTQGEKHAGTIFMDQPYFPFIYYDMLPEIKSASVDFEFIEKKTGRVVFSEKGQKVRKDKKLRQRSGIPMDIGLVPDSTPLIMKATVTLDTGFAISAQSQPFTIRAYNLSLTAPDKLTTGESASFFIGPPEYFEAPLTVRVKRISEGVVMRHDPGALKGRFSGVTGDYAKNVDFTAEVVDAKGRVARHTHIATIVPVPKVVPKPVYSPPAKTYNTVKPKPAPKPKNTYNTARTQNQNSTGQSLNKMGDDLIALGKQLEASANANLKALNNNSSRNSSSSNKTYNSSKTANQKPAKKVYVMQCYLAKTQSAHVIGKNQKQAGVCKKGAPAAAAVFSTNPTEAMHLYNRLATRDVSHCSHHKIIPMNVYTQYNTPTHYGNNPSFFRKYGIRDCVGEAEVRWENSYR